jgi:hypothetical protein
LNSQDDMYGIPKQFNEYLQMFIEEEYNEDSAYGDSPSPFEDHHPVTNGND